MIDSPSYLNLKAPYKGFFYTCHFYHILILFRDSFSVGILMLEINDKKIKRDSQGYLIHFSDWSKALVPLLALEESIDLTPEHWDVIYLVQAFYKEFNTSPAIRLLVKSMEQAYGPDKGNSRHLYALFPKGPAKQATKLAGLPKPVKCI